MHHSLAAIGSLALLTATTIVSADPPKRLFRQQRSVTAAEAHQGVAVDENSLYAIANRSVGKYDKQTGKLIHRWEAAKDAPVKHLNSGVVHKGLLYCAHSNWPTQPTKNSLEILDTETMKFRKRISFEGIDGALTWADRRDGDWWAMFAKYGELEVAARSTLIRFDEDWRPKARWRFPREVLERFAPYSNSGGSWGPEGLLYATGHDRGEVYALRAPEKSGTLELVDTLPANIEGQAIAWDRSDIGVFYGIRRKSHEIVASRLSHSAEYEKLRQPLSWRRDSRNPILPPGEKGGPESTRCMNPWVLRSGDRYQLYYSGGDDRGRQRICLAEASVSDLAKWTRRGPLMDVGAEGRFDARWCVLPHVVGFEDRLRLYYTGNAGRGSGLSAFPGIGLAESGSNATWKRVRDKPVLAPSGAVGSADAIGIAGGSVLQVKTDDGRVQWRFYYTGCPTIGRPLKLNQQKTICLAVSDDGVAWRKLGAVMYRDAQRDYENVGVAGPVVHREDGRYRMWYSAIGTRWGYYSICYAESDDGVHWRRGPKVGDNLQLAPRGKGWERQMVEYPSVIREGDHWRMFYCGNGYGRTGIGTAVSVPVE